MVPGILWSNAGFSSLRECRQLDGIDPRYDPTVIPVAEANEAPTSYTDKSSLRESFNHASSSRFHSIKDFHDAYSSGALTPTDVIEHLLPLIRRDVAQRSPYSTAFMDSKVDMVRQAAEASTQRYKQGKPLGILDGVPFGVRTISRSRGTSTTLAPPTTTATAGTRTRAGAQRWQRKKVLSWSER